MILAFDDTDSPEGGCTTYLTFRVLLELPEFAPKGMPRLVRLNPNAPNRTRGNGAVCLELVKPTGPQTVVGELHGREVLAFPEGEPAEPTEEILERVWRVIRRHAADGAAPAVALWKQAPPAWAYHLAVTEILTTNAFQSIPPDFFHASWDGRGLIGATGAASWPAHESTYEWLGYRMEKNLGTPRQLQPEALEDADEAGCFNTWSTGGRLLAKPGTRCPVLLGLRSRDPNFLLAYARRRVPEALDEELAGWLLWQTNQGTGDHVIAVETILDAAKQMTIEVDVTVTAEPRIDPGGHVFVEAEDMAGIAVRLAAFEPTKGFRDPIRVLHPGDQLRVTGSFQDALHLEKMEVLRLAKVYRRPPGNPRCKVCGKAMKSRGTGQGFACGKHDKAPEPEPVIQPRELDVGSYEVPPEARRHLHRPLQFEPRESFLDSRALVDS